MIDYKKFKWFYTSQGLLVIGGKSAEQNEEVIKQARTEDIIMHTKSPGSPFCVIKGKASEKDINEAAVFCACLSQGWKKQKKQMEVHVFREKQVRKDKKMKKGTFSVVGKVQKVRVGLDIWLGMQNGKLRAAPKLCFKEPLMKIEPGKTDKNKAAIIIKERLQEKNINVNLEEVLQAIPAGGFKL